MNFHFKAPSKTFLLGEYGVLKEGPAIVINTPPFFELKVQRGQESDCSGIHPLSPAGKWLRMHTHLFNNLKIEFIDPWQGSGGFGASSAQFLFVHMMTQVLLGHFPFMEKQKYLDLLLNDFLDLHEGMGIRPSGADVLAQYLGGVSRIAVKRNQSSTQCWPFEFKNFLLFKTGHKINSHEHLRSLSGPELAEVAEMAKRCLFFFEESQWSAFAESLNQFQGLLSKNHWVYERTLSRIHEILAWPEVEAVKGCGAMGADALILLCEDSVSEILKRKCIDLGLKWVGDKFSITDGLSLTAANMYSNKPSSLYFRSYNRDSSFSAKDMDL